MSVKITMDEWAKEISKFTQRNNDTGEWMTAREIASAVGKSDVVIRKRLSDMVKAGIFEVSRQRKPTILGDLQSVACYRIKKRK